MPPAWRVTQIAQKKQMLQDKKTWLKGKLKDPETKQPLADPNGDEEKISQKIVNLLEGVRKPLYKSFDHDLY